MEIERKISKKERIIMRNKAKKRRNIARAISLIFYTGSLLTCFGLFMSIIAQGQPSVDKIDEISKLLLLLGFGGCFSFGKIVLVATKRNN